MKQPFDNMQEFEALLATMMEGSLSGSQRARLCELLRENPEARRFYKDYVQVHAMLEWEGGAVTPAPERSDESAWDIIAALEDPAGVVELVELSEHWNQPAVRPERRVLMMTKLVIYSGIAAMLAFALVLLWPTPENPAPEIVDGPNKPEAVAPGATARPVATLVDATGAKWKGVSRLISVGDAMLSDKPITLTEGVAVIRFHNDAEIVLEAPCEFVPESEASMRLSRGRLVGRCESESSKGFVVQTPVGPVVDVGTEFGVSVDKMSRVRVRVYRGEVEVKTGTQTSDRHSLIAGEMARVEQGRLERVAFDSTFDFRRKLHIKPPQAPALAGQVRWLDKPPTDAGHSGDPANAYLFFERANVPVLAGTPVNVGAPDYMKGPDELVFSQDTLTDSYFVFFGNAGDGSFQSVQGEIVFDRPIIGVVFETDLMKRQDPMFAVRGTSYLSEGNRGFESGDKVEIAPDGRTLRFRIGAALTDQFRVLVASKPEQ